MTKAELFAEELEIKEVIKMVEAEARRKRLGGTQGVVAKDLVDQGLECIEP